MDELSKFLQHPELSAEEKEWLTFRPILGRYTRKAMAALLWAVLNERVEGMHGEGGDYLSAGRMLIAQELQSAKESKLISAQRERDGLVKARETFKPAELLALWGKTVVALEGIRSHKALQSIHA